MRRALLVGALLCCALISGDFGGQGTDFGRLGASFGRPGAKKPSVGNFLLANTGSVLLVNTGSKFLVQ